MTFNQEEMDPEVYTIASSQSPRATVLQKKYAYSIYSFEGTPTAPVISKEESPNNNLDDISVYSKLETASYKSKKSTWSVPFSYYFKRKNNDGQSISSKESINASVSATPSDTVVKSWQITVTKNRGMYKWRFQKSVSKY